MRVVKIALMTLLGVAVLLLAGRLYGLWEHAKHIQPFNDLVAKGGRETDFVREFGRPDEEYSAAHFPHFPHPMCLRGQCVCPTPKYVCTRGATPSVSMCSFGRMDSRSPL